MIYQQRTKKTPRTLPRSISPWAWSVWITAITAR